MTDEVSDTKPRRRRAGKGVRIEQVAQEAGVSITTVSRALNYPDSVSERTRALIWAAIESTGYVPNRLAGSLATSRSQTVGLVIPHISSSIFADSVKGLADKLAAANYELLLGLSGYSAQRELEHVRAFLSQRVAGLVLTGFSRAPETRRLLSDAGIPVVETSDLGANPLDMVVGFSNRDAARAMVKHLESCGYSRIALISLPTLDNDRELARREGYIAQINASGGTPVIVEAANGVAGGAAAFQTLRSQAPEVDAIFCTNDTLAAGCVLEAQRQGIQVPSELGIAGFGDVELAQEFVPTLTTIRVRRHEIGSCSGSLLLERMSGNTPAETTIDLGFQVLPRGSTRRRRETV